MYQRGCGWVAGGMGMGRVQDQYRMSTGYIDGMRVRKEGEADVEQF
jgi:hypothetical protein